MARLREEVDWYVEMSEMLERRERRRKWVILAVAVAVPLLLMGTAVVAIELHRGGYLEARNAPLIDGTQTNFMDILLKQASVSLCSNTAGQLLTYLMVSPPEEGSEPYQRFVNEKQKTLSDLYDKATIIKDSFKHITYLL